MKHTSECEERSKGIREEVAAWKAKYPSYCRNCGGTGVICTPGSSVPYGATSVDLPDNYDPCSVCVEVGRCPRCGRDGLTSETRGDTSTGEGPCRFCEWDHLEDYPPSHGDECICPMEPADYF